MIQSSLQKPEDSAHEAQRRRSLRPVSELKATAQAARDKDLGAGGRCIYTQMYIHIHNMCIHIHTEFIMIECPDSLKAATGSSSAVSHD